MLKRLLLSSLAAAALTASAPVLAQDHDALRMVTSFAIEDLNPFNEGYWMQEFGVAELLVKFERDGSLAPWLLSAYEAKDDLTWVLTVREGVTFQNGKALDANAVMAAINMAMENSTGSRGAVPEGTTFEVTGDYEITIKTVQPWPALPGVLANEGVFLIFDAEAVAAAGDNWPSLAGKGIYTGPYEIVSLSSEALVTSRFDNYWRGKPALPGVTVSFVSDANARILAVQNDEADIALYPPAAANAVVAATPGLSFVSGTPGTGGFMGFFNVKQAPFDEVPVRQALMQAIDYKHISETVFQGLRAEAQGLYNTSFDWALTNYTTDVDAAALLLDNAGWTIGADGKRSRDGVPLDITMLIYPQQPDLVPLANDLQAQLHKIGVGAEIRVVDDIYAALLDAGTDWDLALSSETNVSWGVPDNFMTRYVASTGGRNYGYKNERVDALIAEMIVTVSAERRADILREIQTILVEEDPYVFATTIHKGSVVVNDRYRNYEPGFALHHITWQTAPADAQ